MSSLKVSTANSSAVPIEVISSELVYSDNWYRLICEFEIPAINVECEFIGVQSQGNLELTQKLVPNDPVHAEKRFGESVDISNNFAIVGAPHDNPRSLSDSGSIYFLKYKILSEMTPTPTNSVSNPNIYTFSYNNTNTN